MKVRDATVQIIKWGLWESSHKLQLPHEPHSHDSSSAVRKQRERRRRRKGEGRHGNEREEERRRKGATNWVAAPDFSPKTLFHSVVHHSLGHKGRKVNIAQSLPQQYPILPLLKFKYHVVMLISLDPRRIVWILLIGNLDSYSICFHRVKPRFPSPVVVFYSLIAGCAVTNGPLDEGFQF